MVFCAHQTIFFRLPFAWIFNPKNQPKTLPKPGLNPPKSSPERPKTHKNRRRATTSAARDKECAQEAPKSEKWSQHGLNMAEGSLGRWNGWPPLKHVKAGIYSLYIKAYCFDTPGHRKRCGGFNGSAMPPTPTTTTQRRDDDDDDDGGDGGNDHDDEEDVAKSFLRSSQKFCPQRQTIF